MKIVKKYITVLAIEIVTICIFSFLFYRFLPSLLNPFVTFAVGISAFIIYIFQKDDFKQDAANIILIEIRNAERMIDKLITWVNAQHDPSDISDTTLLPTNNWPKYTYLFVKDLDIDDIELVNSFYEKCFIVDKSLSRLNIANQLDQKANHIHSIVSQIAYETSKLIPTSIPIKIEEVENMRNDFNFKKEKFLKIIEADGYRFSPGKPTVDVVNTLKTIQKITTSSVGDKLKKIAKFK